MGNSILLTKIITMGYCIYLNINNNRESLALLLIFSLVIMALGVLIPAIAYKPARLVLLLLSLAAVAFIQLTIPLMLLLVPILCLEWMYVIRLNTRWGIPVLLILFPLSLIYDIQGVYTLVLGFCIALFTLINGENKREFLQKQCDSLSLENDRLNKKIRMDAELKQQWTYTAQLEERNNIAQEIHDKVGHSISGSLMQLEAIKLLAETNPPKASAMLNTVIQTLRGGLESIRITLRNIKPPSEQMGLNHLQLILDEFKAKHGFLASLTHEGDISRISPIIWKIYIANTTEGLTNILRHSNANQVSVSLHVMNRMIRLQMCDNGSVSGPIRKGLGLAGMEERLYSVEGKLIIDTGRGFSLSMLIPLKEEHHGHKASAG